MGPQEKRLLGELAVYLVRSCSRALQDLPPGATLDLADRRRWFVRAYHEWQLTPRVDLAGRSPYEVIAAERAAERATSTRQATKAAVELYTDLPTFDPSAPFNAPETAGRGDRADREQHGESPRVDTGHGMVDRGNGGNWQRLAERLFGSWLDEKLDRL